MTRFGKRDASRVIRRKTWMRLQEPSTEPLPAEQAISNEEQAILWRSIERIPEIYREPLVLFYREHQSVEAVAQSLELDRGSGRGSVFRAGENYCTKQVFSFVEGALEKTSPGTGVYAGRSGGACRRSRFPPKPRPWARLSPKAARSAKAAGAMGCARCHLRRSLLFWGISPAIA